jgi:hypothetical protein
MMSIRLIILNLVDYPDNDIQTYDHGPQPGARWSQCLFLREWGLPRLCSGTAAGRMALTLLGIRLLLVRNGDG